MRNWAQYIKITFKMTDRTYIWCIFRLLRSGISMEFLSQTGRFIPLVYWVS
jgi:hypothetical protein